MRIHCAHTELVDLDELIPNPKNPNKHPENQIKHLAKIMKVQGWRSPIVVSNRSGFITKGHGRLQAAFLNNWTQAPIDRQDYESEAAEYADMVADNAIAELSETDLSMVNQDVLDLGPDFDTDLLGIPGFEVEIADKLEPQCDEDEVPEHVEPRTKPGDIYQLGRHRLMCGDATNVQHIEALMNGNLADLIYTDPPYGIDVVQGGTIGGVKACEPGVYRPILNDGDPDVAIEAFHAAQAVSKGIQIWWGGNYYAHRLPSSKRWLVWDKQTTGHFSDCELAWTNMDGAIRKFEHVWNGMIKASERGEKRVHPTQKPVAMAQWCFAEFSGGGKNVLDLFGGSGSTLIGCEKSGCYGFIMELDPKYCDVIVARWEKYTGQKAELLEGTANGQE